MPYSEDGTYYDQIIYHGESKTYVIAPKITQEENEKRWKSLENTLSRLLKCKVTLVRKEREKCITIG